MSLKNSKLSLAALSVVFVLQGCGSTQPKLSEADILAAERSGTLQTLYHEIKNGTGRGKSLKPIDQSAYLSKIGKRLAGQTTQSINSALNSARLSSKIVPLSVLDAQSSRVEVLKNWDKALYDQTLAMLNDEIVETEKAIAVKKGVMDSLDLNQLEKKYAAFNGLKALYGDAKSQQINQLGEQMLSDVYDLVDQFVSRKDFDNAIGNLKRLVKVAPDFKDATAKLEDLENTALQESFITYVNEGETEKAKDLLGLIYKGKYFGEQKGVIMPQAMELANYYIAMGVESTSNEDLAAAYNLFSEARDIKAMFGMQNDEVTQEADFIDFIYALYEESKNKKAHGMSLGYLYVIKQMRPNFPELETFLRTANDNVMSQAVKRVSTTAFNGDEKTRSLGRSISSKITQFVFDTLPHDVRVVEREQLNAVLREQEISALKQGTGVQIDSADLLIQGTILESNVETTESPSSRRMRVVTARREVANPAYARWLEKSSSERAKVSQPARTITKEKEEDIDIKVTHVRKVAVLSISYRVVDATSARVIYADSVMDKKKLSDETTEGIQLGEFKSEYKVADLPSDSELLSDLTVALSQKIGNKVVELLKDPENEYQAEGKRQFDERNYVDATEEMAKALVMTLSKNKPAEVLEQHIREYAVSARLDN